MPSTTEQRNYLIFATFFIVISFFIMKSFVSGIIWGGVTAMSVWPIFEKLSLKKRFFIKVGVSNNALIFALIFFFLFFIPIAYAISEITNLYSVSQSYIDNNKIHGNLNPPEFIKYLPLKEKIIIFWNDNIAHSSSIIDATNKISNGKLMTFFTVIWSEMLDKILTVLVMIISFYFMLKNGEYVQNSYKDVFAHWIGEKSVTYIDNGIQALRGTINGVVLIGILEGLLLSIPLLMGDVNAAVLIGLTAGILGVIPLLMPALILPCLAYMYMTGEEVWAFVGAIDLLIVWFVFENILKPQMISQKVKINTFIILVSMIGGMQLLGPVGLFLGPAVVSMAIGMVRDLLIVPKFPFNEHPISPNGKDTTENVLETLATIKEQSEHT